MAAEPAAASQARDRRPRKLDGAELTRQAKRAKADLERACLVPVPDGDADDLAEGAAGDLDLTAPSAVEASAPPTGAFADGDAEEAICGKWVSGNGECAIFEDQMTGRLCYEEMIDGGDQLLHGWLIRRSDEDTCWQATLMIQEPDQLPWYGPSFGEAPEAVGDIQVRLLPGAKRTLETRIRVAEEDTNWQPPVTFTPKPDETQADTSCSDGAGWGDYAQTLQSQSAQHPASQPGAGGNVFVFGS